MDIPETLATLSTQDEDKQSKTKQHRTLQRCVTRTSLKPVTSPCAREG